jgi:hypothetical protein
MADRGLRASQSLIIDMRFQDKNYLNLKQSIDKSFEYEKIARLNYDKLNFKVSIVDYKKTFDIKLISNLIC